MASRARMRCCGRRLTRGLPSRCVSSFSMRTRTSSSARPWRVDCRRCRSAVSGDHWNERIVFTGAFGGQRPFGAHGLVEFVAEERGFESAVDDVPRLNGVFAPVSEDEVVGVDLCFFDGGPPVPAVAFGGDDGWGDAAVAE